MDLEQFGYHQEWQEKFGKHAPEGTHPVRVLAEHRDGYRVMTQRGEMPARLSGRFREGAQDEMAFPAVGDFACARIADTGDMAVLDCLLPRKGVLHRMDSFNDGAQVLAANVDTVLLCMSLNRDFSLERLERYLALAWAGNCRVAVALTKADLAQEVERDALVAQAIALAAPAPVHAISAQTGQGLEALAPYFAQGETIVALGSSGVGKSTLLNALVQDEVMRTRAIREDDARGRHTTVHRQMVLLPSGALYIDTPGLREVGLFDAEEGVGSVFVDIEELAQGCRFRDCAHAQEPGCAVRAAIEAGTLEQARFSRYEKLLREAIRHEKRMAHRLHVRKRQQKKG